MMKPFHKKSTSINKKGSRVKQQTNILEHYFSSNNKSPSKIRNDQKHVILPLNDTIKKSVPDPSYNEMLTIRNVSKVYPAFDKNQLCDNKSNVKYCYAQHQTKETANSLNIEKKVNHKNPVITTDFKYQCKSHMLIEAENEIGSLPQLEENNLLELDTSQMVNKRRINNNQLNNSSINKITEEKLTAMQPKECFHSEKKQISGKYFKEIIYNFNFDCFCKPYKKLYDTLSPGCVPSSCIERHKSTSLKEITSFCHGPIFNILDNPVTSWVYDISTTTFSALRPDQYLRGDVICILFDYILNGPSEDLMWDVKHILCTHFEMHPPCTEKMQDFYLGLLDKGYEKDCFFKTELSRTGILSYIMNQLKEYYKLPNCSAFTAVNYNSSDSTLEVTEEDSSQITNDDKNKITFETLEERWDNYEPLFENEYNEVMNALDEIGQNTSQETKQPSLNKYKLLPRMTVVLELIVDLLEANFLIYISKMKRHILDNSGHSKLQVPLINHFMNINFNMIVFNLYTRTTDQDLCTQLSRLIGLMAEQVHLSKVKEERLWQYPHLHKDCYGFASDLSNVINKCNWSEDEKITRLQMLHPPWLQLQLAMGWANKELNLKMGTDLKNLVEIIHMHVKSPVKLEKDVKKVKHDTMMILSHHSKNLAKRATKRNNYGETLLHRLCKHKRSSLSEFYSVLALPETDVNAKDYYGWTPLHEAVNAKSLLKTKALLNYHPPPGGKAVDIGVQNCKGTTPLHEAVSCNNLELCQLLVDYGGVCLLRKTDLDGSTPLDLVQKGSEINHYFEKVIKVQELLNLSPDSYLNLTDYLIQLLMLACDSFIADHYTWQIYRVMKFDDNFEKVSPDKWVVVNQETLIGFKHDQDQFRKLRRILNKLAENPGNSALVRLWDSKFQDVSISKNMSNTFSDKDLEKIIQCRILLREQFQLED